MELREVLARRRMHRSFLPEPIADEQIRRIVSVIRHAPSGGFTQGLEHRRRHRRGHARRDRPRVRRRALHLRRTQLHRRRARAPRHLRERGPLPRRYNEADSHPDQKRIFDELLGLPEDVVPIGLALVGRPGPGADLKLRLRSRRRPTDELVRWERW